MIRSETAIFITDQMEVVLIISERPSYISLCIESYLEKRLDCFKYMEIVA